MSDAGKVTSGGGRRSVNLSKVWRYCVCDGVPRRSFYVALVVGAVLNIINQPEALFGLAGINWTKLALTFVVPYCVATYGAVSLRLGREASAGAAGRDAEHEAGQRRG